jgi:hypothetical protein
MPRGRYAIQWRNALGDGWEPPDTVISPGTTEAGGSSKP